MKKVLLKIGGMSCSACSSGLEKYLRKQEGILEANVNLVMNNASISYDETKLDVSQIEVWIKKAGFESLGLDDLKQKEQEKRKEKRNLIVLLIFAIIVLYLSMAPMVGLPTISFLDPDNSPVIFSLTLFILTIAVLYLGRDLLSSGVKNLIHKTPNMDTLVSIGVISAFLYSIFGTVQVLLGQIHYVHTLYYESAVVVIFFIKLGRYIDGRNKIKTKEAIQSLMTLTPQTATIIKDGKEEQVTIDEIQKGDFVFCKPGEKIAVDGKVTKGSTHINESFITGESLPASKEIGDLVMAGSINYDGTIEYKAEKIGKDSTVSEIVRLVVEATNTKAPIAKIADRVSLYFVPFILILAVIGLIFWLAMGETLAFAMNIFITLLVIACPCALGLATPLAIVIASGNSAKKRNFSKK